MLTSSQKKYLFAIYRLGLEGKSIRSTEVSKLLNVTKASTVKMSQKLAEEGYIYKEPYREIRLTPSGVKAANELFTPSVILQDFLENSVGLDENSAKEDSITMITQLSEKGLQKLIDYALEQQSQKAVHHSQLFAYKSCE